MRTLTKFLTIILIINAMDAHSQETLDKKTVTISASVSELIINSTAKVEIISSAENRIDITGDEEAVNRIQITDAGDTKLRITGADEKSKKDNLVQIIIYKKDIKKLFANAVGELKATDCFDGSEATISGSGIGNMFLNNKWDAVNIHLSAIGQLHISGSSKSGTIKISSVGALDIGTFESNGAKLEIKKDE
jgi:acyl carrier protein